MVVDRLPIPRGKWGKARYNMTFKPIETQEQFDELVKDRISRAKESARKELEAEIAELATLKEQMAEATKTGAEKDATIEKLKADLEAQNKTAADLTGKIAGLEAEQRKVKIAREVGLPYEMASRLTGDTDEDLTKDAESIKALMGTPKTAPRVGYEQEPADDRRSKIASMLQNMDK